MVTYDLINSGLVSPYSKDFSFFDVHFFSGNGKSIFARAVEKKFSKSAFTYNRSFCSK